MLFVCGAVGVHRLCMTCSRAHLPPAQTRTSKSSRHSCWAPAAAALQGNRQPPPLLAAICCLLTCRLLTCRCRHLAVSLLLLPTAGVGEKAAGPAHKREGASRGGGSSGYGPVHRWCHTPLTPTDHRHPQLVGFNSSQQLGRGFNRSKPLAGSRFCNPTGCAVWTDLQHVPAQLVCSYRLCW